MLILIPSDSVTPLYSVLNKELAAMSLCKVWAAFVSYLEHGTEEGKQMAGFVCQILYSCLHGRWYNFSKDYSFSYKCGSHSFSAVYSWVIPHINLHTKLLLLKITIGYRKSRLSSGSCLSSTPVRCVHLLFYSDTVAWQCSYMSSPWHGHFGLTSTSPWLGGIWRLPHNI